MDKFTWCSRSLAVGVAWWGRRKGAQLGPARTKQVRSGAARTKQVRSGTSGAEATSAYLPRSVAPRPVRQTQDAGAG